MPPPRNLPNLITGSRLVMAAILFVLLALLDAARRPDAAAFLSGVAGNERLLLNGCLAIFVTASFSDFLDGYIARRWNLQTDFGRIVDPFADKVIVCGTFVLLVPLEGSQVSSWMVVVILARELLVDGLRGFAESKGVIFPSMWIGKIKMSLQSFCLCWIFALMANAPKAEWGYWLVVVLLWATILVTVYSGLQYVFHARKVLSSESLASLAAEVPAADPGPQGS